MFEGYHVHGEKVDPTTIEAIELSIKALQETLSSDDADKIRARSQDVTEASMKLGEAVYKSQQKDQPKDGGPKNDKPNDKEKENVVDADFEDVKEDKEKSA